MAEVPPNSTTAQVRYESVARKSTASARLTYTNPARPASRTRCLARSSPPFPFFLPISPLLQNEREITAQRTYALTSVFESIFFRWPASSLVFENKEETIGLVLPCFRVPSTFHANLHPCFEHAISSRGYVNSLFVSSFFFRYCLRSKETKNKSSFS